VSRHRPETQAWLASAFRNTVEWLVATQNTDGSWGTLRSQDQQRSPRVLTLLSWWLSVPAADRPSSPTTADVQQASMRYLSYLTSQGATYGIKSLVRTTGMAGLALADALEFGATFVPE